LLATSSLTLNENEGAPELLAANVLRTARRPMGFYGKHILPHLINSAMSTEAYARSRSEAIPAARGEVLEIGIGSGLNLPFYRDIVTKLYGVDPSPELLRMAQHKVQNLPFPVVLCNQSAETLFLQNEVIDTVVVTWTLCTIPNVVKALKEIWRVLKPGGELIFIEHGLAPEPTVRKWQNRMNGMWRVVGGGCNLNRPIDSLIGSSGFVITDLERSYLPGPKALTHTYRGRARK
jgi:SAM-dependent methyltransferase